MSVKTPSAPKKRRRRNRKPFDLNKLLTTIKITVVEVAGTVVLIYVVYETLVHEFGW